MSSLIAKKFLICWPLENSFARCHFEFEPAVNRIQGGSTWKTSAYSTPATMPFRYSISSEGFVGANCLPSSRWIWWFIPYYEFSSIACAVLSFPPFVFESRLAVCHSILDLPIRSEAWKYRHNPGPNSCAPWVYHPLWADLRNLMNRGKTAGQPMR